MNSEYCDFLKKNQIVKIFRKNSWILARIIGRKVDNMYPVEYINEHGYLINTNTIHVSKIKLID